MRFLLDTDHLSILQRGAGESYARLSARLRLHPAEDFALSVVSFHEQTLGCHAFLNRTKTTDELIRGYAMLDRLLDDYAATEVLAFDAAAAGEYDRIRAMYPRVGRMDLRIAAIALSRGLILLTRNARDFGPITGLIVEDWTC